MTTTAKAPGPQALAPPQGAAVAGIIFSILMIVGLGLVRYAIPADLTEPDPGWSSLTAPFMMVPARSFADKNDGNR